MRQAVKEFILRWFANGAGACIVAMKQFDKPTEDERKMNPAQAAITRYLVRQLHFAESTNRDQVRGLRKDLIDATSPADLSDRLKARLVGFRATSTVNWDEIAEHLWSSPLVRRAA